MRYYQRFYDYDLHFDDQYGAKVPIFMDFEVFDI